MEEYRKQQHAMSREEGYTQAHALAGWALTTRICGISLGSLEFIISCVLAADVFGEGYVVLIGILLAATTILGSFLISLILEVLSSTAIASLDSASMLSAWKSAPLANNINKNKTYSLSPSQNPGEESSSSSLPEKRWFCPACGNENEAYCNVCASCGIIIK